MSLLTCPACGHQADFEGEPHREILNCTECRSRIAYGVLMPRVVVEPHKDKRFVIVRVETVANGQRSLVEHVLDKQFGHAVAKDIASITAPPRPLVQLALPDDSAASLNCRAPR